VDQQLQSDDNDNHDHIKEHCSTTPRKAVGGGEFQLKKRLNRWGSRRKCQRLKRL